jgi:hypothetical protein
MNYYRWPSGIFENLGEKFGWCVMKYRPMASTPAGDLVSAFKTKEEADEASERLNDEDCDLYEARRRYLDISLHTYEERTK